MGIPTPLKNVIFLSNVIKIGLDIKSMKTTVRSFNNSTVIQPNSITVQLLVQLQFIQLNYPVLSDINNLVIKGTKGKRVKERN